MLEVLKYLKQKYILHNHPKSWAALACNDSSVSCLLPLAADFSVTPQYSLQTCQRNFTISLFLVSLQEQEQMQCYNQRMIEILKSRQQQEKNRMPKIQRGEAKTRMAMFKKSLRINSTGSSSEDREKIKQVLLEQVSCHI